MSQAVVITTRASSATWILLLSETTGSRRGAAQKLMAVLVEGAGVRCRGDELVARFGGYLAVERGGVSGRKTSAEGGAGWPLA
jgi:hypothetical protein